MRHWAAFFALLLALDLSSITALKSYAGREIPLSAPEDYAIEDGRIVVPLESLQDEHLHRYEYTAKDGIKMRFILIKKITERLRCGPRCLRNLRADRLL